MLPYLVSYYGNPHSRTHAYGWETEAAIEKARKVCVELVYAEFCNNNCKNLSYIISVLKCVLFPLKHNYKKLGLFPF